MKNALDIVQTGIAGGLVLLFAAANAAPTPTAAELPCLVPFEVGDAEFAAGDRITIVSVKGTKDRILAGETYSVEGSYTLKSRDEAELAFYVTTREPVTSSTDPQQILRIKRGTGTFRLLKQIDHEGYPHVTFYPAEGGSGFGGVYFGQGDSVLRQKGFSYLPLPAVHPRKPAEINPAGSLSGPNRALLEYLGEPVEVPAKLESAYTQDGLRKGMESVAERAGVALEKIEIDDSEYPFLVGVICEDGGFPKLQAQLEKGGEYAYQGAVGSHTCYTVNMVPWRNWPTDARQQISRRAMLRLQVFHERLRAVN